MRLNGNSAGQGASINLNKQSTSAFIDAAYRQIFGRDIFVNQRVPATELKLKSGEITVREFVRQVAKSRLFRQLYWDSLYVTKATESIHRRLLGRPTYGRQETGLYYDICARKGFYALIDAVIDSSDYLKAFGEDTVPYERYVTPRGYEMRVASRESSSHNSSVGEPRVADGTWVKAALQRAGHLRQNGTLALLPGAEPALLMPAEEQRHLPEPKDESSMAATAPSSASEDPANLVTASAQSQPESSSDSYG